MVASAAYLYLAPQLPSTETYKNVQLEAPLRIYTADRRLIDEIGNRRDPVSYEQLPDIVKNAVIASEDPRFYSHSGVDIMGLMRGFYGFVRGVNLGGGSTITMQLAKKISFDDDNIYSRKLKEIPFALQIQRELTKEEILTLYLNLIYFGAGADGIGAAAYVYYGKRPEELSVAEAAMLTSLLPCPSVCNPLSYPERAKPRRDNVLRKMFEEGMISTEQLTAALTDPVAPRRRGRNIEVSAPYVAEMVRQRLYDEYGEDAYTQGFEVITTIDTGKQLAANKALLEGLEAYDVNHGYRGVDGHYPATGTTPVATWLAQLDAIPVYGNQHPAIVTEVGDRSVSALLKSGEAVEIGWDGLSWARPYITPSNAWPPPRTAADIVQVGDLIRVRQTDKAWALGQVPAIQGALVSMSPTSGEIIALVGGYDFRASQVNRVLTPRPPGSNFKPFVYGAALEKGYTAATTINDAPLTRGGYRPNNYENNFVGPITLRNALAESRNVPAVRLYDQVTADAVLPFAARFGFKTGDFPRNDLTVALGSQDVQPLELVTGYSAIANGGRKVDPWFIQSVSTLDSGTNYKANPVMACDGDCAPAVAPADGVAIVDVAEGLDDSIGPPKAPLPVPAAPQIIDARVAYILNSMLRSVVEEGSGRGVQRALGRSDLMGKTGTTNGPLELWFSGFNRDIATTVFVGFDQPSQLGESEQGATVAVPIWIDYMEVALDGLPERRMPRPDGLVDRLVDKNTGKIARPGDPNSMFEYFRAENAPDASERVFVPGGERSRNAEDTPELSTELLF